MGSHSPLMARAISAFERRRASRTGMAFWPRWAQETALGAIGGLGAGLSPARADVVQDDLARAWRVAVLDEVDGLPPAQHGLAAGHRHAEAHRREHRLDVTWHVV